MTTLRRRLFSSGPTRGLVGELDSPERLLAAVRALRARGFTRLDAYGPFPVAGLESALHLPRSGIGWIVFPIAMAGAATAYLIQWWTNAVDYPLNVGGRPPHAAPAFVPITFEMGVLTAALSAILLALVFSGLPRLHHPLFELEGFERATVDRFFVVVDATDPAFDVEAAREVLSNVGAVRTAELAA
jgi:hypothetical protein